MKIEYRIQCENGCGWLTSYGEKQQNTIDPRRIRCAECGTTHYATRNDVESSERTPEFHAID